MSLNFLEDSLDLILFIPYGASRATTVFLHFLEDNDSAIQETVVDNILPMVIPNKPVQFGC